MAAKRSPQKRPDSIPSASTKGQGHRSRLRERFLRSGLDGFLDYEIIELLLTLCTPRRDCKDSAKEAMRRFKSLQGVLEASPQELCQVPGIGSKNLLGITLIKAVSDRYVQQRLERKNPLTNATELYAYLVHRIRDKHRECFEVLFLDAKNRVLCTDTLFTGSLTASAVYPREVVDAALRNRAAALIFAHNHPSGDPDPSTEDVDVTRQLVFACRAVGIAVHEHLIMGAGRYFSFADHGMIARMNQEFDLRRPSPGAAGEPGY